jgi:hypothetical protein
VEVVVGVQVLEVLDFKIVLRVYTMLEVEAAPAATTLQEELVVRVVVELVA